MTYRIISETNNGYILYYIQSNKIFKIIPWFWYYVKEKDRFNKKHRICCFNIPEAETWIEEHNKPKEKPIIEIVKTY